MNEGTKISDHLSTLNDIVSKLESIGVKIDGEDKALRLVWFLPSSYEFMKHILMYGKDTLNFEEVTWLHKALEGKVSSKDSKKSEYSMSDGDWEELDLRAASTIRLCLAKNVLANVQGISTAKELWKKLEGLYQAKDISNRLLLKEQFHTLCMNEGGASSANGSELNASFVSFGNGRGFFLWFGVFSR
ncbi:Zinc finger, CCHC-type [Senna tora]|uniref:Zinc finger, CCHC-type n=1 Tax=Senna tora TaxID=362788 RepID=A0A834WDA6_9FABA|nr:Zinc finger, CCHC-type [Senna tora]